MSVLSKKFQEHDTSDRVINTVLPEIKPNKLYNCLGLDNDQQVLMFHPKTTAHLVIDVQEEFCSPFRYRSNHDTQLISQNIRIFTDAVSQKNILTAWVYSDRWNKGAEKACGGFYNVRPPQNDPKHILIGKNKASAFRGSDIHSTLQHNNVNTLIVTGFNLSACVHQTVNDALNKGYKIYLVADCVGNDNDNSSITAQETEWHDYLQKLERKGATITTSRQVMKSLSIT